MTAAYHDRFADALRAALPEGFTVNADRHLVGANFGTALLSGFTPDPADKRKPVEPQEVTDWIDRQAAKLRRNMYHYTPEAKAAAAALLAALDTQRSLEIFFRAEANREQA